MSFVHKPNTGSLFPNTRKETETHPDFTGDGLIDGKPVWISMWINQRKEGQWYKISVKPKEARVEVPAPASEAQTAKVPFGDGFEDEKIPW